MFSRQATLCLLPFVMFSSLAFQSISTTSGSFCCYKLNAQVLSMFQKIDLSLSPDSEMATCSWNSVLCYFPGCSDFFLEAWEGHVCSSLHLRAETRSVSYLFLKDQRYDKMVFDKTRWWVARCGLYSHTLMHCNSFITPHIIKLRCKWSW